MMLDTRTVEYTIKCLWLAGVAYWVLKAFGNKKTIQRQLPLGRLGYFLLLVALYVVASSGGTRWMKIRFLPEIMAAQITGIVLCAAGIAFAIWARRVLGANWSGLVTVKENHELIRRGPYRWVRHPIYSGILLAALGSFSALRPTVQGLICLAIVFVALRFKSLQEERLMVREFPEDYLRYKREVKAIIPFIY